jgi:hypothetical protein
MGNGTKLLTFKKKFFTSGVPVQPLTVRYRHSLSRNQLQQKTVHFLA